MITVDYANALPFFNETELIQFEPQLKVAHDQLHKKTGPGSEYLGWLQLPSQYDKQEFARIRKAAQKIRRDTDVLVVIGIGGSYLGARAAIELLSDNFNSALSRKTRRAPLVVFAGNSLSGTYLCDLFDLIADRKVSVNVISKSGTTTEPAVAFRMFKNYMEERYGKEEARERIYVTTDKSLGALKGLADEEGYETFVVPDDVGGRYSVLTAVGLLPIAAAGIDIREMMRGARDAMNDYKNPNLAENPCYQYAVLRNIMLRKGYAVEILVNYEPSFHYMTEWWKQLFGESEGKDHRGLFPAGVDNSADLHSMGQFIQDGSRVMFETVIDVEKPRRSLEIPADPRDLDGLNFLAGMDMAEVCRKALQGTVLAHVDGGVPNIIIKVPELTPYGFGELVYFFEKACGISGNLMAVNPFDQPGVENYKQNMFALLGKPGFEARRAELEKRLHD
ncbi:MAG: glucose-6-phosphate isomerase [Ruminococcaceae bacterium]|nr:glucose-6-phosphate isomerase [Oscillospiraceae bacterium]